MKNIIFLDIDGVLNDNNSILSLESVDVLKQLIYKYNAKIVMITSWQMNGTINRIKYQFEEIGIYYIEFIDPNYKGSLCNIKMPSRILGIIDYLKNNEVANYVILDDEYHNYYKLISLNHYRTNTFKGLTFKDLSKIELKQVNLNNFKYINYRYRQLASYELATNNLIKVLKKKIK